MFTYTLHYYSLKFLLFLKIMFVLKINLFLKSSLFCNFKILTFVQCCNMLILIYLLRTKLYAFVIFYVNLKRGKNNIQCCTLLLLIYDCFFFLILWINTDSSLYHCMQNKDKNALYFIELFIYSC